ncbi:MAG: peptidylprolyl isomerase [Firmicutes bacterium]|nr:peptidylprolyl isomerase [Bacillota bacterium]
MNRKAKAIFLLGSLALTAAFSSCGKKDIPTPQLDAPKAGEQIVVMETSKGEIKLRFFPDYAPKAVENFVTHCRDGYYNGVIFHRVIEGFMIQSGDPTGTGTGGESIFGAGFGLEVTPSLHNIRGALAMANTGAADSNGSQFYIVQNSQLDRNTSLTLKNAASDPRVQIQDVFGKYRPAGGNFPAPILEYYVKNGGVPSLDFNYTVFGQVVEGMDVVDAIAAVPTSQDAAAKDRPLDDVTIVSTTVAVY